MNPYPCTLALAALLAASLPAQVLPDVPTQTLALGVDSGLLDNPTDDELVVFQRTLRYGNTSWLQVKFGEFALPGTSHVRLRSTLDQAVQLHDARSLRTWFGQSALFNGDEIVLELVAGPETTGNRILLDEVVRGLFSHEDSICGTVDNRQLSSDPRQGRLNGGCTGWMVSQDIALTAGHCVSSASATGVLSFNVPLSSSTGSTVQSHPNDQYPFQVLARLNAGIGADWAVCRVSTNSTTGQLPTQANGGQWYQLGFVPGATAGNNIRITGYGTVSSPVSPTWNQVQKTHVGPLAQINSTSLRYATDTTGGNSGSPVIHENTGEAIGIHTHAGCTSSGGSNQGTRIDRSDLLAALAAVGIVQGGGTPGSLTTFGSGCPGSVAAPSFCASTNSTGGTLANRTAPNEYAYELTLPGASSVVGFELYSASNTGSSETVTAAIYADTGSGPATSPLQTTTVTIGANPGFYTASFAAPVPVGAGAVYVAVDHSANTTYVSQLTGANTTTAYWRRPPLGGGTWSVSGIVNSASVRLLCAGGGTGFVDPRIVAGGTPRTGSSYDADLAQAAPGALCGHMFGFSNSMTGTGTTLPFNLGGFGAPACDLLVEPFDITYLTSSAQGTADFSLTVPANPAFVGALVYHQWFVFDAPANALGLAFSDALEAQIGG